MPAPYSEDLRRRVVARYEKGDISYEDVASLFDVGRATVNRWLRKVRNSASLAPKVSPGPSPIVVGEHEVALRKVVASNPSADSQELARLLKAETGLQVQPRTMRNTLRRLGITRKKKQFRAAERDRPDVVEKRKAWNSIRGVLDPKKLAFLDETGSNRAMTPTYGWSERGQRIIEPKPASKGKNVTIVAVLMMTGVVAPRAFEGALTGPRFLEYARDVLVPALGPGAILVMDNLRVHYNPEAIKVLENAQIRVLFLPPYSPDLNPIELAWSKLKKVLREKAARTLDTLFEGISEALKELTDLDAEAWFKHCGYLT